MDAVQRALYRLSDRTSGEVRVIDGRIRCTLHPGSDDENDLVSLLADLNNEVLDETLRARIRDQTADVRNLILALAFSNTGLIDPKDA